MSFHANIGAGRRGATAGGAGGGGAVAGGLAPDTLVATRSGPVPAGRLRPGDAILTRDRGYRPLLWAGHGRGRASGGAAVIPPDALGPGLPCRMLRLAPGHALLVDARALLPLLGTAEALAPAAALGRVQSGRPSGGFVHLLLATHELILAEGAWIESLPPLAAFRVFPSRALGWADRLLAEPQAALRPRIAPPDLSLPPTAIRPPPEAA